MEPHAEAGLRVEPPTLYAQSLAHVVSSALHDLPLPAAGPPPARFQAQLDRLARAQQAELAAASDLAHALREWQARLQAHDEAARAAAAAAGLGLPPLPPLVDVLATVPPPPALASAGLLSPESFFADAADGAGARRRPRRPSNKAPERGAASVRPATTAASTKRTLPASPAAAAFRHTLPRGAAAGTTATSSKAARFVAMPSSIEFADYEPGQPCTAQLRLTNAGTASGSLRIQPPSTGPFTVSPLVYPTANSGVVVPGMAATCTVTFTPPSLADAAAELVVLAELGPPLTVALRASRARPELDLPAVWQAPACLVGRSTTLSLPCRNTTGAPTRVRLAPPTPGPFDVQPAEFDLPAGAVVALTVTFAPAAAGDHSAALSLHLATGDEHLFTLVGTAAEPSVSLAGLPAAADPDAYALVFPPTNPQHELRREFTVSNPGPCALSLQWLCTDAATAMTISPSTLYLAAGADVECVVHLPATPAPTHLATTWTLVLE